MRLGFELLETRTLLAHVGLDLNFGNVGAAPVEGTALIAELDTGKIITVDSSAARRLNADGTLDDTFEDTAATDVQAGRNTRFAVISGARVLIGSQQNVLGVGDSRILIRAASVIDGAPDQSYGDDGTGVVGISVQPLASTTLRAFNTLGGVLVSDGGLVFGVTLSLTDNQGDFQADVLYKLTSDGALDADFGSNGVLRIDTGTREGTFPILAADPTGGFVAIAGSDMFKFLNDGTPDAGFGTSGVVHLAIGSPVDGQFRSWDLASVQSDGKIVVGVNDFQDLGTPSFLERVNPDGTFDLAFGDNGAVSLGDFAQARSVAEASDGKIVAGLNDGRFIRLNADGTFDTSFDDDGNVKLRTSDERGFVEANVPERVILDSAGRILASMSSDDVERLTERSRVVLGPDRLVHIDGEDGADTVSTALLGPQLIVSFSGDDFEYAAKDVDGFVVDTGNGDLTADIQVGGGVTLISGDGDDSIRTGDARDSILAGAGADTVDSGGGKDFVYGGADKDSLIGGAGNDKLFGESDADVLSGDDGDDTLFGGSPFHPIPDEFEYFDGNDTVFGGNGRDKLYGNQRNDYLYGNAGADVLDGGEGADRLAGNGSRDKLYGGPSGDRLFGGADGDWLYGNGGNDRLFGEAANDHLNGGSGADTAHGGGGNDRFFSPGDGSIDSLFGDGGFDSATAEPSDVLVSIESA